MNEVFGLLTTNHRYRNNPWLRGSGSIRDYTDPSSVAFVYIILKYWVPDQVNQDKTKATAQAIEERTRGNTPTSKRGKGRLCGRRKGGPSYLKPEVLKDYEMVRKEMVQRFKDGNTMDKWDTWWTTQMKELLKDRSESDETPAAKKRKTTPADEVEMDGFGVFASWIAENEGQGRTAGV
jgi:hypothetical protein